MNLGLHSKWVDWNELAGLAENYRRQGRRIVTTNGCFDLLHLGHAEYLEQARALGDVLIVALNSDRSVNALKGADRPINRERDRALLLAALASVDHVTVFDQDTPIEFLSLVQPAVHVKGGDYDPAKLIERSIVEANGGSVVCVPFVAGYSTTNLIHRMGPK